MIKGWSWLQGSSTASFKTIQTPSGTSPVATGPNDILTLIAGTGITITGDATADSVTIAATGGGGTPAGSTGEVQFNNAGAFGANSNNYWDNTNKRLGIQTGTSPQAAIHGAVTVGSTINNVVTGSISLDTAVALTPPAGTAVKIGMPAAGTGGSANYVDAGTGTAIIAADGDSYQFRVYPCLYIAPATYYKSQNFEFIDGGADPNDAQDYNIALSWGTVTITGETVHYFVEYDINTSGSWTSLGTFVSPTQLLTSLATAADPTVAWPTVYTLGVAPTPYTAGSAQAINIGSGGITEVGGTILLEVDSILNNFGIDYVSGSPASGSFSDVGLGTYDAEISWTDNGGSTNSVARISVNGGGTWIYKFTGSSNSPYAFTNLTNDPNAQAVWGDTYTTQPINFYAYDIGLTPSGNTLFSAASTIYGVTITDTNFYIIKHSITGLSGGVGKILDSSLTYGLQISATTLYDTSYFAWGSGNNVSPSTYGFVGTNQNRDYRAYGYNPTLSVYAVTPLTLSTTATGGFRYVNGSVTYPSGVTQIKILRQVNGAGYAFSKTFTSPTTAFTDDTTDTTWSGNTTITPTSIFTSAGRFDRESLQETDTPIVEIIATAAGSPARYPKLSFGYSAGASSPPTYLAHIFTGTADGYLKNVTGRLELLNTIGATPTTMLGNTNVFNNLNSGSAHFQVKGQNDNGLINTRSDWDTVGFGQLQSGDLASTVVIQPARSTDKALIFIGHASTPDTTNIWQVQTNGGTLRAEFTFGGAMRVGLGSESAPSLSTTGDTNTGFYFNNSDQILFTTGGTTRGRFGVQGLFIGSIASSPLAKLHLGAGSASANTCPLKFTTGPYNSSPEDGAFEWHLATAENPTFAPSSSARYRIPLIDSGVGGLTSGRIVFSTTNGRLTDSSTFLFSASTGLTLTDLNMVLGTTTGTKFGTSTSQKLAFFNSTPVVQRTGNPVTALTDLGLLASPTAITVAQGGTNVTSTTQTYTPTLTNVANLDASTAYSCQYMQVGNTVTVSGKVDVDPTVTVTSTRLGISLPVASNLANENELGGVAFCPAIAGQGAAIKADATNNRAEMIWLAGDVNNQSMFFTFSYRII